MNLRVRLAVFFGGVALVAWGAEPAQPAEKPDFRKPGFATARNPMMPLEGAPRPLPPPRVAAVPADLRLAGLLRFTGVIASGGERSAFINGETVKAGATLPVQHEGKLIEVKVLYVQAQPSRVIVEVQGRQMTYTLDE
ncbi:MAG: hypothetical protein WC789_09755 [Lentisphaeria bacterium]|jgi:ribosome-associated protein YbcJ (S4-like RNA binding protein)